MERGFAQVIIKHPSVAFINQNLRVIDREPKNLDVVMLQPYAPVRVNDMIQNGKLPVV